MARSGILAVALLQNGKVLPASLETLQAAKSLAEKTKEPVTAAILGGQSVDADDLAGRGAGKVFSFENAAYQHFDADLYAEALKGLAEKENAARVLIPSTINGRALAAVLAVKLGAAVAADATALDVEGAALKVKRYQFSGNVLSEIDLKTEVQVATIQPMAFPAAEKSGSPAPVTRVSDAPSSAPKTQITAHQAEESNEIDLGTAERIISGGRGLGNAQGFKLVYDLAQTMKAAVGASRAVVDSGWIAYKHQVGLTGKTVHPKLYIACGISGQIQHLAGMSSAGTIVAINTDPTCPMMQMASIAVPGDVYDILPQVTAEIKKRKGIA